MDLHGNLSEQDLEPISAPLPAELEASIQNEQDQQAIEFLRGFICTPTEQVHVNRAIAALETMQQFRAPTATDLELLQQLVEELDSEVVETSPELYDLAYRALPALHQMLRHGAERSIWQSKETAYRKAIADLQATLVTVLERVFVAVDAEPELPGEMPDEMWATLDGDRAAVTAALRVTVRETKQGIKDRIRALWSAKERLSC